MVPICGPRAALPICYSVRFGDEPPNGCTILLRALCIVERVSNSRQFEGRRLVCPQEAFTFGASCVNICCPH